MSPDKVRQRLIEWINSTEPDGHWKDCVSRSEGTGMCCLMQERVVEMIMEWANESNAGGSIGGQDRHLVLELHPSWVWKKDHVAK